MGRGNEEARRDYRRDIDGLRALAVSLVVLAHAGLPGLAGGFLGVDIFFVISGFVITRSLMKSDGRLIASLAHFYDRRVRRIAPALVTVLATCSFAAWTLFSPDELLGYGKNLAASILFVPNLYFMRSTDYFAPQSHNPLLHLWSLGVEEQFYIAFPVLLWVFRRYAPRLLVPGLVLGLLASLGLSEYLAASGSKAAFFFTGSRVWELAIGALIALHPPRLRLRPWAAELSAGAALAVILAAAALITPQTRWPGLMAAIPCLATAVLISLHAEHRTAVSRAFSLPLVVGLGLISYSLYLWHWPMLEFYERWILREPTPIEVGVLVLIAVALSVVSWRFIEQPARDVRRASTRWVVGGALVGAMVLGGFSAVVVAGRGLPERFSPDVVRAFDHLTLVATPSPPSGMSTCFDNGGADRYSFERCFSVSSDRPNVLLWGDSHARNYNLGFRAGAKRSGVNLMEATFHSCPPIPEVEHPLAGCTAFNREVMRRIGPDVDLVIIATSAMGAPTDSLPAIQRTTREIVRRGSRVVLIGPAPQFLEPVPYYVARYRQTGNEDMIDSAGRLNPLSASGDDRYRRAFEHEPGVRYISAMATLCPTGRCPITIEGEPALADTVHLTADASLLFGDLIWRKIADYELSTLSPGTSR